VYGERGIGKTALAKLILYIAKANDPELYNLNLLTSYYSIEKGQSISNVLQESLNKLTEGIEKNLLDNIGSRVGDLIKNGKFQIGAFGIGVDISSISKETEIYTVKDQSVSILSNIVRSVCSIGTTNNKDGILIVIDEIHNIKDITSLASILRNIVTTLDVDGVGKVSFLLIGYEEDTEKFFEEDSSSKRSFDPIKLDVMPPEEATEVLKKGFDSVSITYEESIIQKNIESAGGYPHSIQILGHNIIETDKDGNINQGDWDEAIFLTAMELRSKDFSKMFAFGKPLRVRDDILVILAESNAPLSRKELDEKVTSSIYQHIDTLKKCGAVKEDEDKKLSLTSPLFRTAIRIDRILRKKTE
jgi:Cdc6-like AAA superfamily ATPase